jgi:membrane associated rhomboid family serine protease
MALPRRAVTWLALSLAVVFVLELAYSYAVGFRPRRIDALFDLLALSNEGLLSGRLWQLVTHLFLHSLESAFHIVFNLLVLYWFGRDLERRWGSRRFVFRYFVFGLGGAAASILGGLLDDTPTIGASGAISGLVASFCIYHWRTPLRLLFLELTGRVWLVIFLLLDVVRLLGGEPLAIEAHWGGMAAAALVLRADLFSPKVAWLRFRRWRLKRRMRVEPGGRKSNGDSRTLH